MRVARRYRFEATHSLAGVPGYDEEHPHTYTVEVVAAGDLDDDGMVVDTAAFDDRWDAIRSDYEGRNLNETHSFPTTVENLAADLLERFRLDGVAVSVAVWEDDERWGEAP